jgi:hypothetical protein
MFENNKILTRLNEGEILVVWGECVHEIVYICLCILLQNKVGQKNSCRYDKSSVLVCFFVFEWLIFRFCFSILFYLIRYCDSSWYTCLCIVS